MGVWQSYYVVATPVLSALFYGLTGSINIGMALATTVMTATILACVYWLLRPFGGRLFALTGLTALVSSILAMNLGSKEEAQLLFVLASYGGFEISISCRRFLFQKLKIGGVLKSPIFKDTAVSRRYRYVLSNFCPT